MSQHVFIDYDTIDQTFMFILYAMSVHAETELFTNEFRDVAI